VDDDPYGEAVPLTRRTLRLFVECRIVAVALTLRVSPDDLDRDGAAAHRGFVEDLREGKHPLNEMVEHPD
jgi:hypothetical protein